ncbi:MAG: BrnT family toxin [Actinomycetota bacterium]
MRPTLTIARNPDIDSTLPYVMRVPIGAGLLLLVRDTWPRTSAVYCHPAPGWPVDAEVIEEIPVRSCTRRGPAIDLLLDRGKEKRSQIVFTRLKTGREVIFWQTATTIRKAKPGARIPGRRASGYVDLPILQDSRERYGYRFAKQKATITRRALPAGDYAVEHEGRIIAAVERKSITDLAKSLIDGKLIYLLADLATLPRSALVVEDRYSSLFKLDRVKPGFIADSLAAAQVREPRVPIVFCETRPLAEEWTYRFLAAALALEEHPANSRAAEAVAPYVESKSVVRDGYTQVVQFEWDPQKEQTNREKHGCGFDEAATAFGDPLSITIADPDHSVEEQRFILLGETYQGRLVVVVHSERGDRIRLISARMATAKERRSYEQ